MEYIPLNLPGNHIYYPCLAISIHNKSYLSNSLLVNTYWKHLLVTMQASGHMLGKAH